MKRIFVFLLSTMLLFSSVLAESATAALQEMYAQAELLMVQGDYIGAAAKFESLGAYSDASQMTMYCKAIAAAETMGLYSMAVDAFNDLGDFKDSRQMAKYYEGRDYEATGEIDVITASDASLDKSLWLYQEAEKIYGGLAFFKDSLTRMVSCRSAAEAIATEQEARTAAKKEEMYQTAIKLEQEGKYQEAISAYEKIGNYKDCLTRIAECKKVIAAQEEAERLAQLEAAYQNAINLELEGKYQEAIAIYQTLGNYKESLTRIAECKRIISEQEEAERLAKIEQKYQSALVLKDNKQFDEALVLFEELADYKESKKCAIECAKHACIEFLTYNSYSTQDSANLLGSVTTSYIIKYNYNGDSMLISTKKEDTTFPVEIKFFYSEDGKLASSLEKGINSRSGSSIASTYTLESTYNQYGDVINEHYELTNVAQNKVVNQRNTKREYTYDKYGNKLTEKGGNALSNSEYSYSYEYEYQDGVVQQVTCFSDGKVYQVITYEYDRYGRLLKELTLWHHYNEKIHYSELLYSYEY